jgi:hypothetical protein
MAQNGEWGMWWDVFVPKVVMEERLSRVTDEFTRAVENDAVQIRALQARLQEIEGSTGWKFVLWSRKRFARLFPPNSYRGRLSRLIRRAVHVWLERGSKFLLVAVLKKTGSVLVRWLLFRPSPPPAPATIPFQPPAPAPSPMAVPPVEMEMPPSSLLVPDRPPRPGRQQFCLYTSSQGNYFFQEIRDLLAGGLEELGLAVALREDTDGFGSPDAWHVVLAPHEFFCLGAGPQLGQESLPNRLIIINTEQPSTHWFRLSVPYFPRAQVIWDIDYLSAQRLFYQGWKCRHLALGYVPDFRPFGKKKALPEHYGTCFLEPQVRKRSPLVEPLAIRPIDLVFFGNPTPRRHQFYTAAAALLAKYHCYFHFSDGSRPLLAGKTTCMNTSTVMGLVQRSKILLNIHRDTDLYFEWQRIVMQGLWQKTLVISEPCSPAPPFRPGIDYVEAPLTEIPAKIDYYLSDLRGRQEAQVIAAEGYRTLSRHCRMRDVLGRLVAELGGEEAGNVLALNSRLAA